jgi:ubiquinone biosynthesis protein COQ9
MQVMDTGSLETNRKAILNAALRHVPFDGWTPKTLVAATVEAGHGAAEVDRFFPSGPVDAIALWSEIADREMVETIAREGAMLKTRGRLALGIRTRLSSLAEHREAVRLSLGVMAQPQNTATGMRLLYRTIDRLWYAAGDSSTDFNFYTKRLILAPIYGSTLLFWIGDRSQDQAATWTFLARRLDDQVRIGGLLQAAERQLSTLPNPFALFGRLRGTPAARRRTRL